MLIKIHRRKVKQVSQGEREGRMPSHAEIHDASATEPSHWGEGMHKQEEVVKKKSFNCGLEKKNTSQEISSGQLNSVFMGARKMSLRAL